MQQPADPGGHRREPNNKSSNLIPVPKENQNQQNPIPVPQKNINGKDTESNKLIDLNARPQRMHGQPSNSQVWL